MNISGKNMDLNRQMLCQRCSICQLSRTGLIIKDCQEQSTLLSCRSGCWGTCPGQVIYFKQELLLLFFPSRVQLFEPELCQHIDQSWGFQEYVPSASDRFVFSDNFPATNHKLCHSEFNTFSKLHNVC